MKGEQNKPIYYYLQIWNMHWNKFDYWKDGIYTKDYQWVMLLL